MIWLLAQGYNSIEKGEYAVLSVSDDGKEISEKDHKRLFEPLYTKKNMGRSGTGLEMTVLKNVVENHKGYIDIVSQKGIGTTCKIYFSRLDDH